MARCRCLTLFVLSLSAVGCVTRADFERVRREQQETRALLADSQVAVDKINRRLDTMQADAGGAGDKGQLRQLERRVTALESQASARVIPDDAPPVPIPMSGPSTRTEAATVALGREQARSASGNVSDGYRRALDLYRQGQAEPAIQQFREFLRASPQSDLADDAQFWIGESYYSLGDYNRAIIEFNEVLLKYPQGDAVPGALLALAMSFANSGDKIDARLILQKLVDSHGSTEEARIGRQQLEALAD